MSSAGSVILPSRGERGIVVFWVWRSLAYEKRLVIAVALAASGLAWQCAAAAPMPGVALLALGNLLLLARGYDNRVDLGKFDAGAGWGRAGVEKLAELRALEGRMRSWDFSLLDVTNPAGGAILVLLAAGLGFAWYSTSGMLRILVLDAAVLLLPHWVTGIRSILTLPGLMVKVRVLERLLQEAARRLAPHELEVMVLLEGGDTKLPRDVKIKVGIARARPELLGLYGQVVLNEVQGRSYPYFYVVLVARRGFGLEAAFRDYSPPPRIVKEFKLEGEVEVLVIRQLAGKRSGYHTKASTRRAILLEGLDLAEGAAPEGVAPEGVAPV